MPTPQPGIFALGTRSHHYLELDLVAGATPSGVLDAIAGLREPRTTTGGANIVIGLAAALWRACDPGGVPAGAAGFEAVRGVEGFEMPATQHDVWVWIAGGSIDVVFDVARAVAVTLRPVLSLSTEQPGFTYRDSRDLTGFEDGTENPPLDEAPEVAIVADGCPGAGSSIAIFQKWVHDLGAFHELSLQDQEAVFGRTKADSVELDDTVRPASAHISRVQITDGDHELEIFRRSTTFGSLQEHGLMFVGFSADPGRFDRMLARMAGADDGVRDRLTHFSTPVSGAYYVVPPVEALRR